MAIVIETIDGSTDITARKIPFDQATGFAPGDSAAWTRGDAGYPEPEVDALQLAVDFAGNAYLPVYASGTGQAMQRVLPDGSADLIFALDVGPGDEQSPPFGGTRTNYEVFALAVPAEQPVLETFTQDPIPEQPLTLYVGNDFDSDGDAMIHEIILTDRQVNVSEARPSRLVASVRGDIRVADPDESPGSIVTTPTGGAGALSPSGAHVGMAEAFGRVFIVDGESNLVYDPFEDAVNRWLAERGSVPENFRLITRWNGRVVLGRQAGAPNQWAMSAIGDPFDWDFLPPEVSAGQAVSGSDSRTGAAPDAVTALIPARDDFLVVGGDTTIHVLAGDPLRGGAFDAVTDDLGISFGRAWAKDDTDRIYFVGTTGGVYRMDNPRTQPVNISDGRVKRLVEAVNQEDFAFELAWNPVDDTLHVFVVERVDENGDVSGEVVDHYVYERDVDAWWIDTFDSSTTGLQPRQGLTFNADDPDDRRFLIAGADGVVRQWDPDANNDDGSPIDASVLIGPMTPRGETTDARWERPQIVLSDTTGAGTTLSLDTSEDASDPPTTFDEVRTVGPGKSKRLAIRARGQYGWVELANDTDGERFSMDRLSIEPNPVGR